MGAYLSQPILDKETEDGEACWYSAPRKESRQREEGDAAAVCLYLRLQQGTGYHLSHHLVSVTPGEPDAPCSSCPSRSQSQAVPSLLTRALLLGRSRRGNWFAVGRRRNARVADRDGGQPPGLPRPGRGSLDRRGRPFQEDRRVCRVRWPCKSERGREGEKRQPLYW